MVVEDGPYLVEAMQTKALVEGGHGPYLEREAAVVIRQMQLSMMWKIAREEQRALPCSSDDL